MIKTILVPATGTELDDAAIPAALSVARLFSAHLDVLHVRSDPAEIAAAFTADGGMAMSPALLEDAYAEAAALETKARATYDKFANSNRSTISTSWHQEVGREPEWVAEYGRTSDLVVAGRPAQPGALAIQTLEAALFDSGRPLLVPGSIPLNLETVAVAWKTTRESARAVSAAMPFTSKAKRVLILTVPESTNQDRAGVTRLEELLKRHGSLVEVHMLNAPTRSTGEALLAGASDFGAGLLVMGGYGHSRLREWVFGGVTEYALRSATLPLLMAH